MKEVNIKNTAIVATLTIATAMLTTFHYMMNNDTQYGSIRRRTNIRPKNRLEFVHITKTGGSSIEVAAARVGIMWGFCHFHKSELFECVDPDLVGYRTEYPNVLSHGHGDDNIHGAEPWHLPPRYHACEPTYIGDAKSFAVVRNPYTRAISEYYCPWAGYDGDDVNNPENLNRFIQENTRKAGAFTHFMQQFKYVYDEMGRKILDHVLRFENLSEEFPALMKQYHYEYIQLPEKHTNLVTDKKLTVNDLDDRTIKLLNRVYELDFLLFDYDMANTREELIAMNIPRNH